MGYAGAYRKLVAAFETGDAEVATLGDVFQPTRLLPDMTLPIGRKIERAAQLMVPKGVGEITVAATTRVVAVDQNLLAAASRIADMRTVQGQPRPDMFFRQAFDWFEDTPDGRVAHHTRLFRGATRSEVVRGDIEWAEYEAELAASEDDPPLYPLFMTTKAISTIDSPVGLDHQDSTIDHCKTLASIAKTHPAEYGALRDFERMWGRDTWISYPPEDFAATTAGLTAISTKEQ